MECKFCHAMIEDTEQVCPVCGKEQTELPVAEECPEESVSIADPAEKVAEECGEAPVEGTVVESTERKSAKTWKVVLLIAAGLVLLAIVLGAVLYGLGFNILPGMGKVSDQKSYTQDNDMVAQKADTVVATMRDQKLTNGELQIYYWMCVSDYLNYYGDYAYMTGVDASRPMDEQIFDTQTGMTYQQKFLETALENWRRYATLAQMAEEDNFALTAEQQEYLDSFAVSIEALAKAGGYENADAFIAEQIYPGCNLESYQNYNRMSYISLNYYNTIFESMIPTQAEIEAYYDQHVEAFQNSNISKDSGDYYDVRHILIKPEGGTKGENGVTTYTDAEWEACREKAQALLDGYLAADVTEEAFAKLAEEHSEDPGSSANGGLYTQLTQQTNFVDEFKNWYLDEKREPGDTGLVKSVHGYHIMYFSVKEPIWSYEAENMILAENTSKMLEEAQEQWPMKVAYRKIALGFVNLAG